MTPAGHPPPPVWRPRVMRWWDIPAVAELERALFPEDAWSAGLFWSELAGTDGPWASRRYWVAQDDAGRVAGYAGLNSSGGAGGQSEVQTIAVAARYQGTGLGVRLLRELLGAAREAGSAEVLLEVRVDNARAQRLYEGFGFSPLGVRRGYYQPGNHDALVMRLDLATAPPDAAAAPAPAAATGTGQRTERAQGQGGDDG